MYVRQIYDPFGKNCSSIRFPCQIICKHRPIRRHFSAHSIETFLPVCKLTSLLFMFYSLCLFMFIHLYIEIIGSLGIYFFQTTRKAGNGITITCLSLFVCLSIVPVSRSQTTLCQSYCNSDFFHF